MNQHNETGECDPRIAANMLTKEEQAEIKNKVLSFMAAHPIVQSTSKDKESIVSPWYSPAQFYSAIYIRQITVASLVALILFGGSSISAAAEGSLPGEILYPIKTQVNERVSGYLAFTQKSKIKLEAELATRRLSEAESLSVKGKLDAETRHTLGKSFTQHAKAVENGVIGLRNENDEDAAFDVSSSFNSHLKAHKSVLSELAVQDTSVTSLFDIVSSTVIEGEASDLKNEHKNDEKTAIEKRTLAEKKLAKVSAIITVDEKAYLTSEIQKTIDEGNKEIENTNFSKAVELFTQASSDAQKLYIEVKTRQSLGLSNKEINKEVKAVEEFKLATTTPEVLKNNESTQDEPKEDTETVTINKEQDEKKNDKEGNTVITEVQGKVDIKLDI